MDIQNGTWNKPRTPSAIKSDSWSYMDAPSFARRVLRSAPFDHEVER